MSVIETQWSFPLHFCLINQTKSIKKQPKTNEKCIQNISKITLKMRPKMYKKGPLCITDVTGSEHHLHG